ncbi:MAG TPA: hypothetical protein VJZ27_08375, partial [Aggregatilineales bacterium]|nr:hypothetical protein [Aggregatilineales bacterium]
MKRPHFITTKLITLFALFCIVSLIPVMVFAQDSDPVLPPAEARNLRVLTLLQHDSPVAAVEFSPAGNFFLSGTVGVQLYIWQAGAGSQHQRGELLYTLDGYLPGVTVTAFDSDEKRLAASLGADGSRIELYDTATGAPVLVFEEHTQPLHSIRFFNEDTQLISYDFFGQVFIFDAQSGAIITQFEDILDFAIAPDDNRIVLTRSDGSLIFYAPDSGSEVSDVNAEFLRFSPGGRWLALWGDGLSVWDAQNRSEYFHVSDAQVDDVIWTPDGRFLITRSFANAEIRAINPAPELEIQTGDVVFSFPIFSDGGLRQITLSPDGQRVVTVDTRGTGRIWRIEAQGEARQIGALSTLVDDVAI